MASLFFPQLSSGAMVQYPLQRNKIVRTIKNQLADGRSIMLPDPGGSVLEWSLRYSNLSQADITALQTHFANTAGPLRAFTFIDPSDNMFVSSAVLASSAWRADAGLHINGGMPDPFGGVSAFTLINTSQVPATLVQTVPVPASFHYVMSFYAACSTPSTVSLIRMGPQQSQLVSAALTPEWTRLVSSGRLADSGVGLTAGMALAPGQSITIYGIQLEAQCAPSAYKATMQTGGVYSDAHWGSSGIATTAQGVDQFSTSFTIESAVWG